MKILEHLRSKPSKDEEITLIDTALVKLYTSLGLRSKLSEFITKKNDCIVDDCINLLIENSCYYSLSLLYKAKNRMSETLGIWTKIASGEYPDPEFGGIPIIIDYLKNIQDEQLIWKYSGWILTRDSRGVMVFIDRKDSLFTYQQVLQFLNSFSKKSRIEYLEYLVHKKEIQDSKIHTDLGILYFNEILYLSENNTIDELGIGF